MSEEPSTREPAGTVGDPASTAATPHRRYRRREIALADGGRLILDGDGSIRRLDDHGTTTRTWAPDDPEWPGEAIRFGLHTQAQTVAPHDRYVPASRPPRR